MKLKQWFSDGNRSFYVIGSGRLVKKLSVVITLLLGFAIRIFRLEASSIWIDEVITFRRTQLPIATMINGLTINQVPFYYLVLSFWVDVLNSSLIMLRLFSVFAGVLAVASVYLFSKTIFDTRTAQIVALVAAFAPFLVYFSRMARAYSVLWLIMMFGASCYILGLRTGKIKYWVGYITTAVIGLYTHLTAVAVLLVLGLFFLLYFRKYRERLSNWLVAQLVIIVATVPLITNLASENLLGGLGGKSSNILNSDFKLIVWKIANVLVVWNTGLALIIIVASFGLLFLGSIISVQMDGSMSECLQKLKNKKKCWSTEFQLGESELILLGLIFLPLLIGIGVHFFNQNLFPLSPRTLSLAGLAYLILLARGIAIFSHHLLNWVLIIFTGTILIWSTVNSLDKPAGVDWRSLADNLEEKVQQGEVIYIHPDSYLLALQQYYSGVALALEDPVQGDFPIDRDNIEDHLVPIREAEGAWIITINDYALDMDNLIGVYMSQACKLQSQEQVMLNHVLMRHYTDCFWED